MFKNPQQLFFESVCNQFESQIGRMCSVNQGLGTRVESRIEKIKIPIAGSNQSAHAFSSSLTLMELTRTPFEVEITRSPNDGLQKNERRRRMSCPYDGNELRETFFDQRSERIRKTVENKGIADIRAIIRACEASSLQLPLMPRLINSSSVRRSNCAG